MNPLRIHQQLSVALRHAARLRQQLESGSLSRPQRLTHRLRHAYLLLQIRSLTAQLHVRR